MLETCGLLFPLLLNMDDNPTKDFTAAERLDHILFRIEKIEDQLLRLENDRARELRKLDTLLATIHKLEAEIREVKENLKR
jgi:septal ring factor EnvC (AmiA/AmiB activator)